MLCSRNERSHEQEKAKEVMSEVQDRTDNDVLDKLVVWASLTLQRAATVRWSESSILSQKQHGYYLGRHEHID